MPRNINRVVLFCGLLALTAVVGGCQRGPTWNLAPVEGTVTKDGQPLRGIEVIFFPDLDASVQGPRSTAITDETGHYRLRTHNGDDGTVLGKHRVVIHDLEVRKGRKKVSARGIQPQEEVKHPKEQPKTAGKPSRVPPSYGRFDETPLRAEVGREPLIFDIAIP